MPGGVRPRSSAGQYCYGMARTGAVYPARAKVRSVARAGLVEAEGGHGTIEAGRPDAAVMLRRWWPFIPRATVLAEVARAIAEHGAAAEAYLNYPLQDRRTPRHRRRILRAALRHIRRRAAKG